MTNSIRDILDNYYQQRTLDLIKQKTSFAKVGEEAKPALWYTETEQAINAYISTAVREARLEEMQERPDSIKFDYDHDRIAQLKEEGTVEPAPVKPFNGTPASKLTGTDITLVEGYNMTEPNLDKLDDILLRLCTSAAQEVFSQEGYGDNKLLYTLADARTAILTLIANQVREARIDEIKFFAGEGLDYIDASRQELLDRIKELGE
jgi:hypothetical protein